LSDADSADARAGRLFHRYWSNPNYERRLLKPDERDLLATSDRLLADVLGVLNFEHHDVLHVEQTITSVDGQLTGTPDQVYLWGARNASLVVDLKSGWAIVERAELNLQLRGYAVLVDDNYAEADRHFVAILQPRIWSPSERTTLAQYDRVDIAKARTQINDIIDRTKDPKAKLVAGEDQCRFCKAKLICPAFRKALNMPLAKFKTDEELSTAKRAAEIEKRLKRCSDEQLEKVFESVQVAAVVEDAVRSEIRRRIKDGLFTNYELAKDYEVRNVTNVRRAIALAALANLATRDEVLDLCTMSLKALETHLRARYGGTWKDARNRVDRALKSVIVPETRDGRILKKQKPKLT
jgi:Protein of unknown function (DUF2800).